jgi:hypothetical protein
LYHNTIDDAPKSCVKTQAQKRKERREKRNLERMKDTSAIRGFSTDQQITIELINVNKQTLKHLQDETQMVAFGLQESAIRAQLSQVQSMAERQCPKYDENNMFWQRVDSLQKRHGESIQTLMNLTKEKKKPSEDDANVNLSEFLLQESPVKKRSYNDMIDDNEVNVVEVLDNSEIENGTSLICKVEKLQQQKQLQTV